MKERERESAIDGERDILIRFVFVFRSYTEGISSRRERVPSEIKLRTPEKYGGFSDQFF